MSGTELGAFIRARREGLSPRDVGLSVGARRRTPGLRRMELAGLAGLSVEYLTRLEQGRDRRPSTEVLRSLAHALRLTPQEHTHLYRLSKAAAGDVCEGQAGGADTAVTVRPSVAALLTRLEPTPAFLRDAAGDILAHTRGFAALVAHTGLLESEPANLAWFVFRDPRARQMVGDWEQVAREEAARLYAAAAVGEGSARRLVEVLRSASPDFAASEQHVGPPAGAGAQVWHHPEAGALRLDRECLTPATSAPLEIVVLLPADTATQEALDHVVGRPSAMMGA
ncbi:helix-turn-helix domain-containing protein [Spiractinospora alimapuensis]|uniref:helix-turn-helix domain-containing protein n=1 Tax=Spiractinospora alimapuensis TaxID=2820884 RepID=UPI001F3A9DBF|nr:helix-turn-helix transcriptional regulator [Spiractinospora alimapuensis]QVQ52579.1 helix-turn-helix domain-containing protein [Spiractinospora alimapuensis]